MRKKKNFLHENPFSCAICRKAFTRKVGLRCHIRKTNHSITKKWPEFLKTVLPQKWAYNAINFNKTGPYFKVKILLQDIDSMEELRQWVESFTEINLCVYARINRKKNRSSLTPYSEFYRCQHCYPKKSGKKRSKGTGCKSTLTASLKCDHSSSPYYATICINFIHNHSVSSGEMLKYRKPSVQVEKVFQRMLEDGLSPAKALRSFIIHLEFQPADLHSTSISDRTKCPDYNWVHHFCTKLFKKNREFINSTESLTNLIKYLEQLNNEFSELACCYQSTEDNHLVVCFVTPVMRRALTSNVSGEIVFIDTVGTVDKFGLRLYLLFTEYNVTRIPLGVIFITHSSQSVIEQAFKLYKYLAITSCNSASFGGRGKDGPVVIMVNQSKTEVNALKSVFPKSTLLFYSSICYKMCTGGYCIASIM